MVTAGPLLERYRPERRPEHTGKSLILAYVFSTIGAAMIIGLGILVAMETGRIRHLQRAVNTVEVHLPEPSRMGQFQPTQVR